MTRGGRAEADRQDQQREPDAEVPVDPRREPDLDHEAGERRLEADLRQEAADRVVLPGALEDLGRHVQLLLDERRADGREADDRAR